MSACLQEATGARRAVASPGLQAGQDDDLREGRRWAEAVLAGERRVLEMIARNSSLGSILEALCRLVEQISPDSLCCISLLDASGAQLARGAAPSLPQAFMDAIEGRTIADAWGPCGLAALRGEPVILADIKTDSPCGGYRDLALANDLRACWSTPILSSERKVLGTFAVYGREPRSPSQQQRNLMEQFAHLASIAIERTRAEEALRRSETYLAEAQKLSHTGSFGWNVSTGEVSWSAETFRILGYEQGLRPEMGLVLQRVHPEDLGLVQRMIEAASRERTGLDFEHRLLMPNGSVKHLHVIAHAAGNKAVELEFVGAVMDVTERKRAEALVAGEKRLLEMIARGNELVLILEALCRFGEEMSRDVLVSILLVSSDGKSLRHGAAPSLPPAYTQAIDGGRIGPRAGSCGTAAYRGQPVIVSDIATDPLWADYRHLALEQGLRACWSTPIFSTTREVMGTFALYSREPGTPTQEHKNTIDQMTHLAAVALEHKRAEEALRRSESRFEGILEIAEDAIISVDARQCILLFNQGAEKVFGYRQSEVIGQRLDLLLPPRFASAHQRHIEEFTRSPGVARPMGQRREIFALRKSGQEFPAEASISKLDVGGELVFTVILRDITERKQAAEALRASEQLARGQAEALGRTLDALARESAPDKLVEHVLRTITEQLGAHSSSVWLRNEATGLVAFEFAFESGKLVTGADAGISKISPILKIDDVRPWPEIFRTGRPSVLEDIRRGPDFPWREHVLSLGVITILIVPMLIAGQVQGVIGIRFTRKRTFRAEEIALAQALSHQAMLAIQLMRLSREGRQAAVAAERNRMARDIHDTLVQGFTGVIVQLEAAADASSEGLAKEASDHLARAAELARSSLREARRSVRALRPQVLEERDLCGALEELIGKMTAGTSLRAKLSVQGEPRSLGPQWDENLLRIGQEVLTNSLRHAQASEFDVQVGFSADQLRLTLRDNGLGFDPAGKFDGFGLLGIRERVESMGGRLAIAGARGEGTAISITLPYSDNSLRVAS